MGGSRRSGGGWCGVEVEWTGIVSLTSCKEKQIRVHARWSLPDQPMGQVGNKAYLLGLAIVQCNACLEPVGVLHDTSQCAVLVDACTCIGLNAIADWHTVPVPSLSAS